MKGAPLGTSKLGSSRPLGPRSLGLGAVVGSAASDEAGEDVANARVVLGDGDGGSLHGPRVSFVDEIPGVGEAVGGEVEGRVPEARGEDDDVARELDDELEEARVRGLEARLTGGVT